MLDQLRQQVNMFAFARICLEEHGRALLSLADQVLIHVEMSADDRQRSVDGSCGSGKSNGPASGGRRSWKRKDYSSLMNNSEFAKPHAKPTLAFRLLLAEPGHCTQHSMQPGLNFQSVTKGSIRPIADLGQAAED